MRNGGPEAAIMAFEITLQLKKREGQEGWERSWLVKWLLCKPQFPSSVPSIYINTHVGEGAVISVLSACQTRRSSNMRTLRIDTSRLSKRNNPPAYQFLSVP